MNRKKILKRITLSILFLGIGISFVPFFHSLSPESNSKSSAGLPRVDISKMVEGEMIFHPYIGGTYNGFQFSLLIYKNIEGEVLAFNVPTKNGNHVGMPDLMWWKPFYSCKNFGTQKSSNGLIFKCLDKNLPSEWWSKKWKWDTTGKSLDPDVSDIPRVTGLVQDGYFFLHKRS